MISLLLRLLKPSAPRAACWCGESHPVGFWHDPTGGEIDRDIQEHARDLLSLPTEAPYSWTRGKVLASLEEAAQTRRDEGHALWWERDHADPPRMPDPAPDPVIRQRES